MRAWPLVVFAAGCGSITPSLGYRSERVVPKADVRVALEVRVVPAVPVVDPDFTTELEPGDEVLLAQTLRDAFGRDLDEHGPYAVDPIAPDARLLLEVEASALGDSTAWSVLPPFLFPLFGLPTYSRRIEVVAKARLTHETGVVLAEAAARASCKRWSGLYYGLNVDFECAVEPALAEVRAQLAVKGPAVEALLARLPKPVRPEPKIWRSGDGPVIAVFDFEGAGDLSDQLSGYLATRLAERIGYRVVPRDELRARLHLEKADSYRECYDTSCQIELGRALAAQKTVATEILRVGRTCAMTATFYDLATETAERAASVKTECSDEALLGGVDSVVAQLERD